MRQIQTIRVDAKGRLVIPPELRRGFEEGEELVLISHDDRITLAKASSLGEEESEDLEFSRRTEEAWKEIDRGEYIEMSWDEFLEELERW